MLQINRPLIWLSAAFIILWYGFGAAAAVSLNHFIPINQKIYNITGKITKTVEKNEYNVIYIENARIYDGNAFAGKTGIIVNIYTDNVYLKGDELLMRGCLEQFETPDNPGGFNLKKYYASQNIFYRLDLSDIQVIKPCDSFYLNTVFKIKSLLKASYNKIADEKTGGVCISMVLGDKSLLPDELKTLFQDNGISHILAISGLHVSIIGMTFYKILRRLGVSFRVSAGLGSFLMISYGIMTGNSVSSIRAIVMFGLAVYAEVLGRTYDAVSALCLSAVIIMIKYPYAVYNSGFLLSFGAIGGIIFVSPALKKLFHVKNPVINSLLVSISVNLTTIPVIMSVYYEVPVYSVFLNIIVVPLMTILMASAVMAGVVGIFSRMLGIFLIGPAVFIIRLYDFICRMAEKLPYSNCITGAPSYKQIFIYYMLLCIMLLLINLMKDRIHKSVLLFLAAAVFALLIRVKNGLEIVMLSVGQGDCMYISCGKYDILIDGGSTSEKSVGKYTILPFLKYKGVSELDYVILTHPDSDHYSGIVELMKDNSIAINKYIMADINDADENYNKLYNLAEIYCKDISTVKAGDMLIDDDFTVKCIHPAEDYNYSSTNDYSVTLLISYGEFDMITTGDLENAGEESIICSGMAQDVEVLKCGHHGSSSSTSEKWLNILRPEVTLISCGRDNIYGHPHEETIKKLNDAGSRYYISYDTGAVAIWTDGKEISVKKLLQT